MRRSTKIALLIVVLAAALLTVLVYLRGKAPPEAARLLPECDGIVYVDLQPLRAATHFDQHAVQHDPAYQRFIDATGFVFERDLREAAFALHRMSDPLGPNGPVAFSEVFVGRFDGKRLSRYLAAISASQEQYAGHTIFSIPSEGRTVRVALLGYDTVAVSNTPTPEQIHSILDRYRTAALPFSGASVLGQYYGRVPALSLAWGVGKISVPLWRGGGPRVLGIRIPIRADTAFVASLRWLGSLKLRIEELAPDEAAASASAATVRAAAGLVAMAENNLPDPAASPDLRALLNSLAVEQKANRAVFTATIPLPLLEKIVAPASGLGALGGAEPPASMASPAPRRSPSHSR